MHAQTETQYELWIDFRHLGEPNLVDLGTFAARLCLKVAQADIKLPNQSEYDYMRA
jgi:hypothetical protein